MESSSWDFSLVPAFLRHPRLHSPGGLAAAASSGGEQPGHAGAWRSPGRPEASSPCASTVRPGHPGAHILYPVPMFKHVCDRSLEMEFFLNRDYLRAETYSISAFKTQCFPETLQCGTQIRGRSLGSQWGCGGSWALPHQSDWRCRKSRYFFPPALTSCAK